MEILIGIIIAALVGLGLMKRKADKAEADAKIAETKGQDKQLEMTQEELDAALAEIDANIKKMKEKKELEERKRAEDSLSLKERADRIKKGLQ